MCRVAQPVSRRQYSGGIAPGRGADAVTETAVKSVAEGVRLEKPGRPTPDGERLRTLGQLPGLQRINRQDVADKESLQEEDRVGDIDSAVVVDVRDRRTDRGTPLAEEVIEKILGIADLEPAIAVGISAKQDGWSRLL